MNKAEAIAEHEALTKSVTEKAAKKARQYGSTQRVDYTQDLDQAIDEEDYPDAVIAPPQANPNMFYGFTGEIAHLAAKGTEVNPVAAAMVFLSFLGAYVGRDTFLHINNTIHHPRLFTLHIGRSGTGKGDAQQLVLRIMRRINDLDSGLLGSFHSGGLSTREGLIMLMHDGIGETPGIVDKRLWIVESEFANVLHQSKREGNTLSSCLREMWDGSSGSPATKSKRIACTNPHIGMHANITPPELNYLLSAKEMSNGFANRFLMIRAENVGNVPFPKPTPQNIIDDLAERVMEIIRFAKGGYPNTQNSHEMNLSAAATAYYVSIYPALNAPLDSDFLTGMLNRRKPYVLRLGMLFALTDQVRVIEAAHLQAAYAWVNYAIDTVKFVFADKAINPEQLETRKNAEKIAHWLRLNPNGASLSDLANDCFGKHLTGAKLNHALTFLLCENPLRIEKLTVQNVKKGRPRTVFKFKIDAEKAEKIQNEAWRGFEGEKELRINCGKMRINSNEPVEKAFNPHSSACVKTASNPDAAGFSNLSAFSASKTDSTDEDVCQKTDHQREKLAVDLIEKDDIEQMESSL